MDLAISIKVLKTFYILYIYMMWKKKKEKERNTEIAQFGI